MSAITNQPFGVSAIYPSLQQFKEPVIVSTVCAFLYTYIYKVYKVKLEYLKNVIRLQNNRRR